jgi:hypothetical protein
LNNIEPVNLSRFFKTKSEARSFSVRLAKVSGRIFETNFHLEPALSDEFGLQRKELFMTLLHEQNINLDKPSAIKDFLTLLQNQINAMPVLSLSIACEPNEMTLKTLSDWFLLSLKRQVLFDITVEPSLIAGLAIHYNGKYLDYSIRPTFAKVISEMRSLPAAPPQITPSQAPATPPQPVASSQMTGITQ